MRQAMSANFEATLAKCGNMKEIREAALRTPELRQCLLDSLEPVKVLLADVILQLDLKGEPFQIFSAAPPSEIQKFWEVIWQVDDALTPSDRTKAALAKRKGLQKFLSHCCQIRHYSFTIKKCGDADCSMCKPPRLPTEVFSKLHYLPDPCPSEDGEHYRYVIVVQAMQL